MNYSQKTVNRFWRKVINPGNWDSEKCFIWNACVNNDGYGQFSLNNRSFPAHKFSYEFYFGPVSDGFEVCHICNNPPCVNPNHLYLATHKENMEYMVECNRVGSARQTTESILEMLNKINLGVYTSTVQIMEDYNMTKVTVHNILTGKAWRTITKDKYTDQDLKRLHRLIDHRSLTNDQVRQIKLMIKQGNTNANIARYFQIPPKTVSYIKLGKTYKDIV